MTLPLNPLPRVCTAQQQAYPTNLEPVRMCMRLCLSVCLSVCLPVCIYVYMYMQVFFPIPDTRQGLGLKCGGIHGAVRWRLSGFVLLS